MEAPTATKTLAAIAIPPTTADTSTTAPLPATAKGPAAVEPPVAAVARALRYNDLRAIYRRYTAKAMGPPLRYSKADYDWCLD
ncbi:hypothetical protein FOWG_18183 [Fusarium oxysporum f. sp. lycopersici MN25]|nr:hypothetical protein FOWG_18183 [Fusarium oxysporum f. sp. lycopersici MN25]